MKTILRYLLFIFSSAICIDIHAQNNWLIDAGGNANDEALDLAMDPQGNLLTTGYFSYSCLFGSQHLISSGSGDIFISKQSADGSYLWSVRAGGTKSDRGTSVTSDATGNIFVTGFFSDTAQFGNFTLISNGLQDVFVAKLSGSGSFLWVKQLGGSGNEIANSIITDAGGNIIVGGQFSDTTDLSGTTYISMLNPLTGEPSYDAFIARLDVSGNLLWSKHGTAKYDDRIMNVTTDPAGNVYACGQYSDTITFSNAYTNNAYNAGLVMMIDSSGNEIWFRRVLATKITTYDLVYRNGSLFMTGDFRGNIHFDSSPVYSFSGGPENNIYLMKIDPVTAAVQWTRNEYSDNQLSSRTLETDNAGNIYVSGYFKCRFTSLSDLHGSGLYYSSGYRDIFILKYNAAGQKEWERHIGGPGDDYVSGIIINSANKPVIAGSYSIALNFSIGDDTLVHDQSTIHYLNTPINYCGIPDYGRFMSVTSAGMKDIFCASPFDPARPYFDYFRRSGSVCNLDSLVPAFAPDTDTITACEEAEILYDTKTIYNGLLGPVYEFLWNTGSSNESVSVFSDGWYHVEVNTADNCRSFSDSVFVEIDAEPPVPAIITNYAPTLSATPPMGCYRKMALMAGDSALLIASNIVPGNDFYWSTPAGYFYNTDSIYAYQPGVYQLMALSEHGYCYKETCLGIWLYQDGNCDATGNFFVPEIHFLNSQFDATDTVSICVNDVFSVQLTDSSLYAGNQAMVLNTFVSWSVSGGCGFTSLPVTFGSHIQTLEAYSSGNYVITAQILHPLTHTVITSVSRNFHLDVHFPPPNFPVTSGPASYCPGDSVIISVFGGNNYLWSGPGIVWTSSDADSIIVVMEGVYEVQSTTIESQLGCSSLEVTSFNLDPLPPPSIVMTPSHGVICPNDSVLLAAQSGSGFEWYGPLGGVIATTQSTYVTTPGFYHYTYITPDGCVLVSDFAEVTGYSTPYIEAEENDLCASGPVAITVQTNAASLIQWNSPLSGTGFTQIVNSPGTYSASVSFCNITTTASITISPSGNPVEIIYSGQDTICGNDTLLLTGSGGMVSYTWLPDETESAVFVVNEPGVYYLQAEDQNGCINGDSITIYSYPDVAPPVVSDTSACAGTSLDIIADATYQVIWFSDVLMQNPIDTGDTLSFIAGTSDSIVYAVQYDGVCYSEPFPVMIQNGLSTGGITVSGGGTACPGDTIFFSADSLPGYSYSWITNQDTAATSTSFTIVNAQPINSGIYILHISNGSCSSIADSVEVIVSNSTPPAFFNDTTACAGDTLLLEVNAGSGSVSWNTMSPGDSLFVAESGNYFYDYTDTNGCMVRSDTIVVVFYPLPAAPQVSDTSVCEGSPLVLFSGSFAVSTWVDSLGNPMVVGDSLFYNEVYSQLEAGIFVTDSNGCNSSISSFEISILPPSAAPVISGDTLFCPGDSIFLSTTAVTGASYNWNGPAGMLQGTNQISFYANDTLSAGIYSLVLHEGYCHSDTGYFQVNMLPLPIVQLSGDFIFCEDASGFLHISGNGIISWEGGTSDSIVLTSADTGWHIASSYNFCGISFDSVYVEMNPLPVLNGANDLTILIGTTGQVNILNQGTYQWTPSTGLSCNNCPNPEILIRESQTYIVKFTDENGCSVTDTLFAEVVNLNNWFVPNSFSPNGDGINDVLFFRGVAVQSFVMRIYDRWGELIFETAEASEGWDGTYREQILNTGTFVFITEGVYLNGDAFSGRGNISIIR